MNKIIEVGPGKLFQLDQVDDGFRNRGRVQLFFNVGGICLVQFSEPVGGFNDKRESSFK